MTIKIKERIPIVGIRSLFDDSDCVYGRRRYDPLMR